MTLKEKINRDIYVSVWVHFGKSIWSSLWGFVVRSTETSVWGFVNREVERRVHLSLENPVNSVITKKLKTYDFKKRKN